MRITYIDLVSGASGDMLLGALVDVGLPFDQLQHALDALHLPGCHLTQERVMRGAFAPPK
ncbi:nickel insertion protein [Chloroflexus aggregans]|uniref:nickel insertion protein n=1 Tax=Chloroflexus aggregans TaxID=152260 RepID=UPI0000E762A7|nr:nickel insertion protein [Chloroflexus aggregans]